VSRIWIAVFCAAILLGLEARAQAVDLYTVFDGSCRQTTGILVHVDEDRVLLIDRTGRTTAVPRESIHSIVLHNILENPLPTIEVDGELKKHLRAVWIGDDGTATFTGWATGFFDDLLIFADIDGKTHVVDREDIAKMEDSKMQVGPHKPSLHASASLAFPTELVPCAKEAPPVNSLPPSRVVADRIKLSGELTKLEEAYRGLDGFEERTRVYARPFVFDQTSRVGLFFHEDSPIPVPLYFRWSSGRPYRFQSQTTIGMTVHEWLPFARPSFSVASNTKSHFFNASFIGNVAALPAGNNAFIFQELTDSNPNPKTTVTVGYNYMILLGADYWRLSVSAGPAYLATQFQALGATQTVLAESPSTAFRALYLGSRINLRALYYRSRISGQDSENGDLVSYRLRADTARIGATIAISEEIAVELDEIITVGKLRLEGDMQMAEFEYVHADTSASVSSSFGRYVTVRGYVRHLLRRYQVDGLADENRNDSRFGGALEFLF
jgi:hypothetical protein